MVSIVRLLVFTFLRQGDTAVEPGAFAGAAGQNESAADYLRPAAHTFQASGNFIICLGFHSKAGTVVQDLELDNTILEVKGHLHIIGVGVLSDIQQGFVEDAVDGLGGLPNVLTYRA
jgi:hypothetical protein